MAHAKHWWPQEFKRRLVVSVVSFMIQSEQIWMLIELFVTLVIETRELDGPAERGSNECQ